MNSVTSFISALSEIVFPSVCVCCGSAAITVDTVLCGWCAEGRFELADYPHTEICPDSVESIYAMWNFDKGGYLQQLLHDLKYNHLKNLGRELGAQMAVEMPGSFKELAERSGAADPILIPVPLHRSKERKRGYNQSRMIAAGIASVTGWELLPKQIVIRVQNRGSQTGLTKEERVANVRNSFQVLGGCTLEKRQCIIVDDVFTTGATVFEMAGKLIPITGRRVMVATVARA